MYESSFLYDDLTYQWLGQGRLEFDKQSFRDACNDEGLFVSSGNAHVVYGVKFFEHAFDRLEDRCTDVLNLISNFNERAIHDDADWSAVIYPKLQTFLKSAARDNPKLRLVLTLLRNRRKVFFGSNLLLLPQNLQTRLTNLPLTQMNTLSAT